MAEISIIIPAYNAEKHIKETLLSVLNQTYKDFQIILVDDGSIDNTFQIADSILNPPHRIIQKKNGGEASARNVGLKICDSRYICFLDSDDLFTPNKLDIQKKFLDNNSQFGMVYAKHNYIIDGNNLSKWRNWNFKESNNGSGDIFIKQFIENKICIITTLIRRECFDRAGYFDESIPYASDSDMWIRISANYKIGYIDEVLAYYRLHNTNVSLDRETCLLHRIASMNKNYTQFYDRVKDNSDIKKSIRDLYYRLIKLYIKNREFKKAKEYFVDYWKRFIFNTSLKFEK